MSGLSKQFETYLKRELKVSGKTLRNYRADLKHFLAWSKNHLVNQEIESLESLLPHFSGFLVAAYKTHHTENNVPQSTTNRRLSTLRNFGKFLKSSGITNNNPTQLVNNLKEEITLEGRLEKIVKEFARQLEKEDVSRVTRKNYLSDIKHFVSWLKQNQEFWAQNNSPKGEHAQN